MDEWMDERMDGSMDGWMDQWLDGFSGSALVWGRPSVSVMKAIYYILEQNIKPSHYMHGQTLRAQDV